MAELPPLQSVNWDSDTCACRVEPRRYYIGYTPPVYSRGREVEPERIWCHLHKLDGSVTEIPMHITTIDEMVRSGLQAEYWAETKRRQMGQIDKVQVALIDIERGRWPAEMFTEEEMKHLPHPSDVTHWQAYLRALEHGKTYADHEGYRRSPGTQTRGHLSHRCPKHHNQTSTSLQSQIAHRHCGCIVQEITVGERREFGVTHEQFIKLCPVHRRQLLAA